MCVAVAVLLHCVEGLKPRDPSAPISSTTEDCDNDVKSDIPSIKSSVRQTLAFVTSWYPHARPTRGMLKQVAGFFHPWRNSKLEVPPPSDTSGVQLL